AKNRSENRSNASNFITDAVKLQESEVSDTCSLSDKIVKLSEQQDCTCTRHNKPKAHSANRPIICVTAVAPRVRQTVLFTLFQLIGLSALVNGCSTRSRYEQKKLKPNRYTVAELSNCTEAYLGYCRNGGTCKMTVDISQRDVPVCCCPPGFRGRQCELINDPNIYFSRQQGQMEMAAMSGVMVAIIFAILFLLFVLYFYRRYMKYGMKGSNSSSTFDTVELSPPINEEKQDSDAVIDKLERNETVKARAERQSSERMDDQSSNIFEMFTLAAHKDPEYAEHRNLFSMITKNRNVPRRARNSNSDDDILSQNLTFKNGSELKT
ncbi:unnamed protein product, partial [Litomosoides sigmodontis]